MILGSDISCGVKQLFGLAAQPKVTVKQVFRVMNGYGSWAHPGNWAHLVFSDVVCSRGRSSGSKLAAFIEKHKLGDIVMSKCETNPNSGRPIAVWVWTSDMDAIRALIAKDKKKAKGVRKPK